jgi:hypothetical protein
MIAPKRSKRKSLYLKDIYGDPSNSTEKDDHNFSLNYLLSHDGGTFYFHSLSKQCVIPVCMKECSDSSKLEVYHNKFNLRPTGPCLYCDVIPKERVSLTKSYDYTTEQYVVWENFCSLECSTIYELEHFSFDTLYVLMIVNKLAVECYGYKDQ